MKVVRAVMAGILGSLAMSLAMFLLRMGGVDVNLEALLGSMFSSLSGSEAWLAGFATHVAIGAVVAIVYAVIFELAVQRSGLLVGGGLGLCHGLLAGLMMSGIPAMNPLELDMHSAPGPFFQNIHYGPFVFLLLHILYGAVVGIAYGHTVQHPHAFTNRTA